MLIEMKKKKRKGKTQYYHDIALEVASRGTCLRRNFGAVIVKRDAIVSTGYTGAPRGCQNCCDLGFCKRKELGVGKGQRYELCRSVHAEANAIINANRADMEGAILYLAGIDYETGEEVEDALPCAMCKRLIINSGISFVSTKDKLYNVRNWVIDEDADSYGENTKVSEGTRPAAED